ncbi:MAG: type III-B CRISPR module RAMP protein Cmr1 [Sulfolobales archaeon]|nr:type III-B CRISPR module RAMP protein Cmr1 [Sulfolobales archaeon]
MSFASIEVSNTTPLLAGWYEPRQIDALQGLRSTEIKGLWRYWARAITAGALYDKGLLVGRKVDGVNKVPSTLEAKAISCLIGKIMGLGYVGDSGAEQSRFKIRVEPLVPMRSVIKVYRKGFRELQRVSLLTIKEGLSYIDKGAKFRITVRLERPKFRSAEEQALKVLVLALQLSGVGKGGRRGLGSLDVLTVNGVSIPNKLHELIEDVYAAALDIVKAHKECKLEEFSRSLQQTLPPMPSLSKQYFQGVAVSSVSIANISFNDAHSFFLRSHRCRKLTNNPICFDDIRNNQVGWFLGLPREQGGRGYLIPKWIRERDITRRASPLHVTYHEKNNVFGSGAYFTTLLSGDWPAVIMWNGKNMNIDDRAIVDAYKIVIGELQQYVNACNANLSRVWP